MECSGVEQWSAEQSAEQRGEEKNSELGKIENLEMIGPNDAVEDLHFVIAAVFLSFSRLHLFGRQNHTQKKQKSVTSLMLR